MYDEYSYTRFFSWFVSGEYDIDPNGGSPNDQITVHCNFTNQATCIRPKMTKVCDKILRGSRLEEVQI